MSKYDYLASEANFDTDLEMITDLVPCSFETVSTREQAAKFAKPLGELCQGILVIHGTEFLRVMAAEVKDHYCGDHSADFPEIEHPCGEALYAAIVQLADDIDRLRNDCWAKCEALYKREDAK